MKSTIVCFFILIAFVSGNAGASEPVQIQLTDGSIISGEITPSGKEYTPYSQVALAL